MIYPIKFQAWLEGWEGFGFTPPNPEVDTRFGRPEPENPIEMFNIEYMRDMLVERSVGPLHPRSRFVNEVTWGDQMGALKLTVNPNYDIYLERLGLDLKGQPRWYCKKCFQINREGYGGYEEVVTQEVYDYLKRIYESPPETAKPEFENFEGLVLRMASRMKAVMRPVFYMDEIRKVTDHRYIISLGVRGGGVGAMDQSRVFKNLTEVVFDAPEGVVRVWNMHAEHKGGRGVTPEVTPSIAQFVFFPSQNWDEITDPVATIMRFF